MKAKETAVVLIEFQNDFCKEGGKLHGGVQAELSRQNTIPNAMKLAEGARKKGALIIALNRKLLLKKGVGTSSIKQIDLVE